MMDFVVASNGAFSDTTVTKEAFNTLDWRVIARSLDDMLAEKAKLAGVRLVEVIGYDVIVYNGSNEIPLMFLMAAGLDLDFTSLRIRMAYSYVKI